MDFNPPTVPEPLPHRIPWKVWSGLVIWVIGLVAELYGVERLGAPKMFFSSGVLLVGLGAVHAMTRLELVARRVSFRALPDRGLMAALPAALMFAGALYYAVAIWFPVSSQFAVIWRAFALVLFVGAWRWWMDVIVSSIRT